MCIGKKSADFRFKSEVHGFTLLEIMISLGILSIIFIVIYGTFNNVYRGSRQTEEDADRYRLTRLGIYYLSNDLSMVYIAPKTESPRPLSSKNSLVFRGENGERLQGNTTYPNDAIEFSTVSHWGIGADAPESEEAVVRYSLLENELIQEARLSNGRTVIHELGGPIEGLSFRYLEKAGGDWVDTWDAEEKKQKPPIAVEIEFILQQENRAARRFKTWVDIPVGLRS